MAGQGTAALARADDPTLDYCLWPYDPPAAPTPGALRSEALLWTSFEIAGVTHEMAPLCAALRARLGAFRTVWGIKHRDGALSWEFYFYDYDRLARDFSIAGFKAATRDLLTVTAPPGADDTPYFMFSVEVSPRHLRGAPIDQIDIYIGNPGSAVSSGICYGISPAGMEMRNFYFFFDAVAHAQEIRDKIASNAHVPQARLRLDRILWPEIARVETIVVANKRHNDGLYFSRIPVDEMLLCLDRLAFPAELRAYALHNRERFAHLLFDVGYDYRPDPSGGLTYLKGSVYGIL